ncbi:hypothetical protein UUU_08280 [Klebsiella pneumoniae subsp. pneumoniae DSM 30104 = JCM 1662 = NBRC 14940]|nr:hypothetical protein UUU_08280 [Klebsiella pneumoniae subsp. pneumoniae DSM 30104 = JCM 1662 = NBRC 14940]
MEPTTTIAMMITVKINAVRFQPSSDLLFICRKYTRCTTICTTAVTRMVPRITACEAEPLITMANGMTVRMMDRINPVM